MPRRPSRKTPVHSTTTHQVRTSPPATGGSKWINAALLVLLAAACAVAYSNTFDVEFQFDDAHAIQENQAIRSILPLSKWLRDSRPIVTTVRLTISGIDVSSY